MVTVAKPIPMPRVRRTRARPGMPSAAPILRDPEFETPPAILEVPRVATGRVADTAFLFVASLALRLVQLDHTPHMDELFHVFAARSVLADGTLAIAGGEPYERARGFTYLVAGMFRLFGESLVAARVPSVVFGSLMVPILYLWVRANSNRAAGWLAAVLLCLYPGSLYLSQLARFYAGHGLLFLVTSIAVWKLVDSEPRGVVRIGYFAVAIVCLAVALHLQITTLMGLAGIAVAAFVVALPGMVSAVRRSRLARIGAVVALAALGLLLARALDPARAQSILSVYRFSDLWARDGAEVFQFYHYHLLGDYPVLWLLLPFLVLASATVAPRFTLYSAIAFSIIFLGHSFAAWKSARYIFYGMPFFFALAGVGISALWPRMVAIARTALQRLSGGVLAPAVLRIGAIALTCAGLAFAAAGGSAFRLTWRMLVVPDSEWQLELQYRGEPDWRAVAAALRPQLDEAQVVISSADLKPIYYLGRLDIVLSATELVRNSNGSLPEFTPTDFSMRPAVSTVASLDLVMRCTASGVVLVERAHWRNPWAVSPTVADFIETRMTRIDVPPGSWIQAFRWSTPEPAADPACAVLPVPGTGEDGVSVIPSAT